MVEWVKELRFMEQEKPKVSVIMATHNGEKFIGLAIDSILSQTLANFEFLIVNDCSNDNTREILKNYSQKDSRIKIIDNEKNLGLTKSLNIALQKAQGEYVARMDDDDISNKERFAEQIDFLTQNIEVALAGSLGDVINERGEIIGQKNLAVGYENIKNKLLFNNQFLHSSLMIRKSVLDEQGFYNEKFKKAQDYELVLRIAQKHKVENLSQKLIQWRFLPSSISNKNKDQQKFAIKARWWAITKYGYPKLQGIFYIVLRTLWLYFPKWAKAKRRKK